MNRKEKYKAIRTKAQRLHLSWMRQNLEILLEEAEEKGLTHLEFLDLLLTQECRRRDASALERRMREACFPYIKRLEDFDTDFNTGLSKQDLRQLGELNWVERVFNLILIGPPGVGKTHLAISLGIAAAESGYAVSYVSMKELIQLLKTEEIIPKNRSRLKRIRSSRLLIIDEVGYLPVSQAEAGLFFHLLAELHEKASILITSNKDFDQWPEFFGDPDIVLAALDRIVYHCDIIRLEGRSYRLEHRESLL